MYCKVTTTAGPAGLKISELKRIFSFSLHHSLFYLITGLGRIAGILSLSVEDKNSQLDAIQRVGSQLAMHVVAAKPLFLTKELVSSDALESEREILKSQVLGNSMFFLMVAPWLCYKHETNCDM